MVDKPGVTTFDELAAVEAAVAETGRIFSICFSERFVVPSTDRRRQADRGRRDRPRGADDRASGRTA